MTGGALTYKLIRTRRRKKTISLQITPEGKVVVRSPLWTPREEIDRFFLARKAWIARKMAGKEWRGERWGQAREFAVGETFFYLGDPYPLAVWEPLRGSPPLVLFRGKFLLARQIFPQARQVFERWYRDKAREVIGERVLFWARRFDLNPTAVTITGSWRRYGSCSPENRVCFSWRLLMAPYPVIDYIILHELAHIRVKNHSRAFWEFLETLMPEYGTWRRWLREKGHLLHL